MPFRDPEKRKEWNRRRRLEKPREREEEYKRSRLVRASNREAVLAHYSPDGCNPRCSEISCDVSDLDMLVLDHVNDDGAEERKRRGLVGGGINFYVRLRLEEFPPGYQTLCCNHNQKKQMRKYIRCSR